MVKKLHGRGGTLLITIFAFWINSVLTADSSFDDSFAREICGGETPPKDPFLVSLCLEMTQVSATKLETFFVLCFSACLKRLEAGMRENFGS